MSSHAYYEDMKRLAREKRAKYGVDTSAYGLREIRQIYKQEAIRIDYYPLPYKIKALYMCADSDCSVAVQRSLPDEPKLFALTHELKHHFCDQDALGSGVIHCGDYNMDERIEKGAEVFAAEFIYPEAEFAADLLSFSAARNITGWQPEHVVALKRACKAKVSYRYLCKRLERLSLIAIGQFDEVQFQKLEDSLHGVPFYRQRRAVSRRPQAN